MVLVIDTAAAAREAYEAATHSVPTRAGDVALGDRVVRAGALWTVLDRRQHAGQVAIRWTTSNPLFPDAPVTTLRRFPVDEVLDVWPTA